MSKAKTRKPKPPPFTVEQRETITLLIVSGIGEPDIIAACIDPAEMGLTAAQATKAIAAATEAIAHAASYDRVAEIGRAIVRLNDLYRQSLERKDTRTGLAIQRELNKLLRLYPEPSAAPPSDDVDAADASAAGNVADELAATRAHLLPLGLAAADAPTVEHARLAVARIIDLQGK